MNDSENGAAAAPPEKTEGEILAERIAALEGELAESKDKLLRALAEAENTRRRTQREITDAGRFGVANFAKDMLAVADNLHRALASAPPAEARDELTRTLIAGVAATERELLASLERHGVKRVEPQPGDRFDHNFHEAMFEIEAPGQAPGSIVQVLQHGYMIFDRLLRPAMVGVAKAGPAPGEHRRVDQVV
ncbi:MAG TPA: nucleotide exchange factor GrpE [Stellaceae bacterium]|nr:nucleotide exchange factor GrpE [Stellaceae bacterium]